MIYIAWIGFALLVGLLGNNKSIGFGWAFFWSILLSPLIGLIIVLASEGGSKKAPKYKELKELGKKAEFRKDYNEALKHFMDSLYHLENDYKNKKLSKALENKRQTEIEDINKRIQKIKNENPEITS